MTQQAESTIDAFRPPWYLRSGHLQTLITGFYRPKAALPPATEHRIPLKSGGALLIHENQPSPSANRSDSDPSMRTEAVLLLHGLGSSHAGTYMTNIAHSLLSCGVPVFRMDLPGAGDSYRFTELPAHGACFKEVWECLTWFREKEGIRRWRMAGVSLGGNILLRMLAAYADQIDAGDETRSISVLKAVAVAPPIDLEFCCRNIESGVNRVYTKYFLRALKKQSIERAEFWPRWKEQLKQASFRSIRAFDETMTAPLAGFASAQDYYSYGSSLPSLPELATSTSILVDEHDPIVPIKLFQDVKWSKSTRVFRTRFGGHVGYLGYDLPPSNNPPSQSLNRWADPWIARELLRPT